MQQGCFNIIAEDDMESMNACLSRMGRLIRSSHAAANGRASQDPSPSRFTSQPSPDGGTFNVCEGACKCFWHGLWLDGKRKAGSGASAGSLRNTASKLEKGGAIFRIHDILITLPLVAPPYPLQQVSYSIHSAIL
eukprot:1157478-Pelagomonas_calceolata.AAC.3